MDVVKIRPDQDALDQPGGGRRPPPRLVLILGALLFLGAGMMFLWSQQGRLQAMQSRMRAMKGQLAQALEEQETLKTQLAELDTQRRGLAEQLDTFKRQATEAQQSVAALQQAQEEAEARYGSLKSEKEAMAAQLAAAVKERDEARQQMARLLARKNEIETEHQQLKERYASVAQYLKRLKQSQGSRAVVGRPAVAALSAPGRPALETGAIELPPILVHQPAAWAPPAGPPEPGQSRVVEVNERYRFIVVDLGSTDGIEPGMLFDVARDGLTIGTATVKQVREHLSACDVGPASSASIFQVGDVATLRRD